MEAQIEEAKACVFRNGWELTGIYAERESGTTRKRPQYQKLVADISLGMYDIVCVKSVDRINRNTIDYYVLLDTLRSNNTRLFFYLDNSFYEEEDSDLILAIKAVLAEQYSKDLSKKIRNSHHRRQEKRSGYNITTEMFGWDKIGKDEFVINETEAYYYRMAFELVERGYSFHKLADEMMKLGVRSKRGTILSAPNWRHLLTTERAHGEVILNKTHYDFAKKKRFYNPKELWIYIPDALPAIVSKEYQEKVLALIKNRNYKT